MIVSGNFRKLSGLEEAKKYYEQLKDSWKDPSIPESQYNYAVKNELEAYHKGAPCAPFRSFTDCLLRLPPEFDKPETQLLEIGASGGYYGEVMRIAGFRMTYAGLDYSPEFEKLSKRLYPDQKFYLANADKLPFEDNTWDIVVSGCMIIHCLNYEEIIKETIRVAKKYVMFSRNPIYFGGDTEYYYKEAYGVPCIEIHFAERELYDLFNKYGLKCIYQSDIFYRPQESYGMRTIMTEKM
jgi:2-polyprenyl-3-methyl-5-hydroxy-6-metoxy-1,4-benzoquinol methylase